MSVAHEICDEIDLFLPIGKKEEMLSIQERLNELTNENTTLQQQIEGLQAKVQPPKKNKEVKELTKLTKQTGY